jgi:hypothetical protein
MLTRCVRVLEALTSRLGRGLNDNLVASGTCQGPVVADLHR